MKVAEILENKGTDVIAVGPDATVAEAARVLSDNGIGLLVVSDDDYKLMGVISERDIVRLVGEEGGKVAGITVDEVFTKKVVTCSSSDRAESVLATMCEKRFRHMPVLDNGMIAGILSAGDIVKALVSAGRIDQGSADAVRAAFV